MNYTEVEIILFIFSTGTLLGIAKLIWVASKRDAFFVDAVKRISKLEKSSNEQDELITEKIEESNGRIIDIEKELIGITSNQKNLLHSIDNQNFQILDLIDRLEKNHQSFIMAQAKINDKLESAINAIKDSLINISNLSR